MPDRVTAQEIWISRISGPPGWEFVYRLNGERPYLQIKATTIDVDTGLPAEWTGRKWFLSFHMTETEVVSTAFKALMAAQEHEMREWFT